MFDDDWEAVSVARHKSDETDKLMRLAAPRERFAFGALALLVLAAAMVAALGSIDRNLSLQGKFHRAGADGGWRASLLAAPAVARKIEPGMAARIELVGPSGAVLVLPGEVVKPGPALSPGTPSGGPTVAGAGMRRIAIAADTGGVPAGLLGSSLLDGSPCRVVIPLGRQSILRALLSA